VFLVMVVACVFPALGVVDKPEYFGAALFLWGAVFFGAIAATGRFDSIKKSGLLRAKKTKRQPPRQSDAPRIHVVLP